MSFAIQIRNEYRGEDRASRFSVSDRIVFVVADGAGGVGNGAVAAEIVLREVEAFANGRHSSASEALSIADSQIAQVGGMSTGVIVEIREGMISGASCGDSVAWLINDNIVTDLTKNQLRKPLLGNGGKPISFGPVIFNGRLLLASDGLVNYVARTEIISGATVGDLPSACNKLASLTRLKSGAIPDDITVILAEMEV